MYVQDFIQGSLLGGGRLGVQRLPPQEIVWILGPLRLPTANV